jgi:hypothetical protein
VSPFKLSPLHKRICLRLICAQQLGHTRDIRCDPPSLIACEQPRGRAPSRLLLEIDVGERGAVVVTNDEGRLVDFFQR